MPDSDHPRAPDDAPRIPEMDGGTPASNPSLLQLVLTLMRISVSGFGGVLPFARRILVEDKRWMTAEEFNKLFAVCHFLPGPNVINMSAVFGLRLHGLTGAIAGVVALTAVPVALLIVLGILYDRYGAAPGISGALAGLAAGVAGFIMATAVSMAAPLVRRRSGLDLAVAAAAFVAIAVLRLPLLPVLAAMAPLSIALAWWTRR